MVANRRESKEKELVNQYVLIPTSKNIDMMKNTIFVFIKESIIPRILSTRTHSLMSFS